MHKIRVLMIEDNDKIIELIENTFKKTNIKIVLLAKDGIEALELIKKTDEYDIIVLDIVIPNIDGLKVLETLRALKIDKKVIISTSLNSQELIRGVSELGASYYLLKPYDPLLLKERIIEISKEKENIYIDIDHFSLKITVTRLLHELGIPSHIKGHKYLRKAIIIVYEAFKINNLSNEVYLPISKKYDVSVESIERAIRNAIEISWNRGNYSLIDDLFGHSIDIEKAKPTNSEFIKTIADKLKLQYCKNKKNL